MIREIFVGEGLDAGAKEVIEQMQTQPQPFYIKLVGHYVVTDTKPIPSNYQINWDKVT